MIMGFEQLCQKFFCMSESKAGPFGVTGVGEQCHPLFKEGSCHEIKLGMDVEEVEGGICIELSKVDGKGTCCEMSLVPFPLVVQGNEVFFCTVK